ncbi:MAG: tetratricopeptide repeat protein [Thaumarchaeota archaeon]|nr:tetratricopeptide repeat protein [Nitrososphaerota archaeon]
MRFPSLHRVKPPERDNTVKVEPVISIQQEEPAPTAVQPTDVVLTKQDEDAKFDDNKKYVTKTLTAIGIPLVLRSEQKIQIQQETVQEILLLLEENASLKDTLQKTDRPIIEEDEYVLRVANFYHLTGNSQRAVEMYEKIIRENPTKMSVLNNIGVVLDSTGNYDSALENFNDALKRVPENVHVLSNKGITLYKSEKYEQAIECFDAALKIDSSYINALTFKGHSLYRLGKNKEALDLYNKVIRLDNNHAEALYNKACLCSMKDDEYGAITSLQKAIRLDSSWRDIALQDKDLDRLKTNTRFREITK